MMIGLLGWLIAWSDKRLHGRFHRRLYGRFR